MDTSYEIKIPKEYDLYVWDFDLTILKIHSYAERITPEEVKSMSWRKLISHFYDPIFFRDLVNYLHTNNKKLAIVSFGKYYVIEAYLNRLLDNHNIFTNNNIITPNDQTRQNLTKKSNKNQHLINLSKKYNIPFNKILYFDDSFTNIEGARELGINAIHIDINNKNRGFTKKLWDDILSGQVNMNNIPEEHDNEIKNYNQNMIDDSESRSNQKEDFESNNNQNKGFRLFNMNFNINTNYLNILAVILLLCYLFFPSISPSNP